MKKEIFIAATFNIFDVNTYMVSFIRKIKCKYISLNVGMEMPI